MVANVKLNVENTKELINLLDGLRKNNKKYIVKSKLIKKVGVLDEKRSIKSA